MLVAEEECTDSIEDRLGGGGGSAFWGESYPLSIVMTV